MEPAAQSDSPDTTPAPDQEPVRLGMVTGVYIPTLLTILGVIMYLRLGCVVGSVGLTGWRDAEFFAVFLLLV